MSEYCERCQRVRISTTDVCLCLDCRDIVCAHDAHTGISAMVRDVAPAPQTAMGATRWPVRMRPITDTGELQRLRASAVSMYWLLMRVNVLALDECSRSGEQLQADICALLDRLDVKP